MSTIMKIGDLDISEYCNKDNMQINKTAVYGSQSLTALTGAVLHERLGNKYTISLALDNIPDETAQAIGTACAADKVTVGFAAPCFTSAKFDEPEVSSRLQYEDENGVKYWEMNISMVCELVPRYGL